MPWLNDIFEAIGRIRDETAGVSLDAFEADWRVQLSGPASISNLQGEGGTGERSSNLEYYQNLALRYWNATGVGGIFMVVGALLFALGLGSFMTSPTRIETRTGGPGVVLRTKIPGHTPTKSDIRRGWNLLFWGALNTLFGACITFGPTVVYNALRMLFLGTIG